MPLINSYYCSPSKISISLAAAKAVLVSVVVAFGFCSCKPHSSNSTSTNSETAGSDDGASPSLMQSLRLLVISDPELAEVIPFEWRARMSSEIEVTQMTTSKYLSDVHQPFDADVVVFPSRLIGELAENRRISRISDKMAQPKQYAWNDLFALTRRQESRWGKGIHALPLGSPQLTLLYRTDILANLQLSPPTTWSEYDRTVAELAGSKQIPNRVVEPRGVGWAGNLMLARAASYARHRTQYSTLFDLYSMQPLIDSPPFERALTELAKSKADAVDDPHAAAERFLAGEAAIAIAWPSHAHPMETTELDTLHVGFASLPGSPDVYNRREQAWQVRNDEESNFVPLVGVAGRMVAITTECKSPAAALNMAQLLSGLEWSSIIGPRSRSTTMFRNAHVAQSSAWVESVVSAGAARQYGETVALGQSSSSWLITLRIPGQHRYMDALDEAVLRVITDGAAPADELSQVGERWKAITDEYGKDAQKRAYSRDLGLED